MAWIRTPHFDGIDGLAYGAYARPSSRHRAPDGRQIDLPGCALPQARVDLPRQLGFRRLIQATQVHGAELVEIDRVPTKPLRCDGFVVRGRGLLVGVRGADCPGVLLVDPVHKALALVHAGWRGTAAGIAHAAVERLTSGSSPEALLAWIGPGISQAHYEVQDDVAEAVLARARPQDVATRYAVTRPGHGRLDLPGAIASQLLRAGLRPEAISRYEGCTYAESRWHSVRRDGGDAGRHVLVAGWTGDRSS